jgi:hypothetical protein
MLNMDFQAKRKKLLNEDVTNLKIIYEYRIDR